MSTTNRQVLTVMPCVSAAGEYNAPLIIFEGKTIDTGFVDYNEFDCIVAAN